MARPLRIEYPGAVYHVTTRGDGRKNIFLNDTDRNNFLQNFCSTIKNYNWLCHAYCLMDNHYHLLLETPDGNLSKGMRQLNGVYTQKFNFIHKTVGHLFQSRYKAFLIEKDPYLLEVARYIVLNPVRAGKVTHQNEWEWSSYLPTAGRRTKPTWLTIEWILNFFNDKICYIVININLFGQKNRCYFYFLHIILLESKLFTILSMNPPFHYTPPNLTRQF